MEDGGEILGELAGVFPSALVLSVDGSALG